MHTISIVTQDIIKRCAVLSGTATSAASTSDSMRVEGSTETAKDSTRERTSAALDPMGTCSSVSSSRSFDIIAV